MIHNIAQILQLAIVLTAASTAVAASDQQSEGCGKALPETAKAGETYSDHFDSSGGKRDYTVYLPELYNTSEPAPLIFSYHGRGGNPSEQEGLSELNNTDYNPNAIAVFPQGRKVR
jgi:poly(3-hydroxybutyrate) depolymerase